jgi:hypothetical protein
MSRCRKGSGPRRRAWTLPGAIVALAWLLCGPAQAQGERPRYIPGEPKKEGNAAAARPADEVGKRYEIYGDTADKFIPGGFMPDGQGVRVRAGLTDGPHSGKRYLRISYTLEKNDWVGVAFMLENSFKPRRKFDMYKALGAKKGDPIVLRLYARSADGVSAKFKAGGLDNDEGEAETSYMKIGPDWSLYQVDVTDLDLTSVHGALTVLLDRIHNEEINRPVVSLDLDEVYFTKLKARPRDEAAEK